MGLVLIGGGVLWRSGDREAAPEAVPDEITFGEVLHDAQEGRINLIEVDGTDLRITYLDSEEGGTIVKMSKIGANVDLETFLPDNGVSIERGGSTSNIPAVDLRYSAR